MSGSLQVGPLVLPLAPLMLAVAALSGLWVGKRLGRHGGVDAEPVLMRMLLLSLVAARLAFVWTWRSAYLEHPLSMLDVRDGGWDAAVGVAAGCLYALAIVKRQPALRRAVAGGLLTTVGLWGAGFIWLSTSTANEVPLPALRLAALEGGSVELRDFTGKPTVVNLWATWCPPCRREMPLLYAAQLAHPDVHFVFVNQGEDSAPVKRFLQEQRLPLRNVLLDKAQQAGAALDRRGLPTTLFFDARGRLMSSRLGELSTATLAQRLQALRRGAGAASPPAPSR